MNEGFGKLFWGFLFVFIEIHFVFIDILPDPIGYILIYTGLGIIVSKYPTIHVEKARGFALALIFFSVPTIFIAQNEIKKQVFTFWSTYSFLLEIVQFILIFYTFQVMLELAKKLESDLLYRGTSNLLKVYTSLFVLLTILQTFGMNFYSSTLTGLIIFLNVITFVIMIIFLVHLRQFKKWP
ncbi:hypothetical protein [Sutcliffiella cohnii]|uniref:hypothetical protein n=1 Tax=Sutcliffiella cohnii TaxID=33932 RepID=UPI002E232C70|nr:hypothetical protein [Sutcliffiella cohnii]